MGVVLTPEADEKPNSLHSLPFICLSTSDTSVSFALRVPSPGKHQQNTASVHIYSQVCTSTASVHRRVK